MQKPERQHTALKFTVSFDEPPSENIEVVAYAFTPQGRLLSTAPLKANMVELDMPLGSAASARIFLVGKLPATDRRHRSKTLH